MPIKSIKMKISKNKKMCFFLISQRSLNPKIRFPGQKMCSVARLQTDTQTDTHTKVTTEGTLLGFQEFFLQPIIKDRPKKKKKKLLPRARFEPTWSNNPGLTWQDQWTWRLTIFPQWRNLRDRFFKRSDAFCEVRPRISRHFFPPFLTCLDWDTWVN